MSQRIVTANVPRMKWLHLKLAHYHVEMVKILAKLYVLALRQFVRAPNRKAVRYIDVYVVKGHYFFMISVIDPKRQAPGPT